MQNQKKIKITGLIAGLTITCTPGLRGDSFEDLDWGLNNAAVTPEGYLDVTKAPYSLKNNGTDESRNTTWLQNAINDAFDHNLAIFFPAGTYALNNQVDCFQEESKMTDAHVFVGSATGPRPVIQLKNGNNFGNTNNPKSLINYFCSANGDGTGDERPAAGYNFVIRGLDFDLGNHAGAIAIDLQAAQGCTIQDVRIAGTSFYAGVKDLCGSGGHHANLEIEGGKHAFFVTDSRPMPVLTGITCINQTDIPFKFNNPLTTITIVGFRIEMNINKEAFNLQSVNQREHLNLIDGSIEYTGPKATKAIHNKDRSIYLRNVYVKNITSIVQNDKGDNLIGSDNWSHVGDYNFFHKASRQLYDNQYSSHVYGAETLTTNCATPPSDLQSRHLWNESTFPHWEMNTNDFIKLTKTGPGGDDTNAINTAIADAETAGHNTVFLGKGDYEISGTITLKKDTRLFGVSRNLTRIHCKDSFSANSSNWAQMITTPDDKSATCLLAWMALVMPDNQNKRVYYTNWKAGRHSMVREVNFRKNVDWNECTNNDMKRLQITSNGGGRWYGLYVRAASMDGEHPDHRMFYINTKKPDAEPLSIYAYTVEYQESLTYMSEIEGSSNISIYGLKAEGDVNSKDDDPNPQYNSQGKYIQNPTYFKYTSGLGINNSTNIMIMGQSGLAGFHDNENEGIIELFNGSTDIMIANADGGWKDHVGYEIIQNLDAGKNDMERIDNPNDPAALYLVGNSPTPIVYTPPTTGGGGSGGTGEIQEFVVACIVEDSGKESETKTNNNASDDDYLLYKSKDAGDYIQFDGIVIPDAGEYDIYVTVQKGDNAGILQLQVNNNRENIGDPVDLYSSTYFFERIYFGTKSYTSGGNNRRVAFEVTGKNTNNIGNNCYTRIDSIEFVPVAGNLYDNDCTSGNTDDDFDPINGTDMNNWSYTNGKLECADSWKRVLLTQGVGWSDYTVDVDVEDLGGGAGNKDVSTVLLRCSGGENYYGVLIDKNNDICVGKKTGSWQWSSPVASGANHTDYNLSIDVSGSSTVTIDVYVNGNSTPVINYIDSDNPHQTGGIGFEARSNNAAFDNIVVQ